MSDEIKRPNGVVIYGSSFQLLADCQQESAGAAIQAAAMYYLTGEIYDELQGEARLVFNVLRRDFDAAFEKYTETCKRNKANRNKGKQGSTSGDEPLPPETYCAEFSQAEYEQSGCEMY